MDERFKNYLQEEIKCLFDGIMCRAVFEKNSIKFIADGSREIADIKYVHINCLFRGTFPNVTSVYFKEGKDKNHTVQTFKTLKFIEYTKWGKFDNEKK